MNADGSLVPSGSVGVCLAAHERCRTYRNDQIAKAVRKQLMDAVDAAMDFASSSTNGLISQAGQTGKVGDYLFGVVNAFGAM